MLSILQSLLQKATRPPGRPATARASPRSLAKMAASRNEAVQKLAEVLRIVSREDFTAIEVEQFGKIEALRERLLQSEETVSVIDYGAGTPNSKLTEEAMSRGVVKDAKVATICRSASTPQIFARLLFKLIHEFKLKSGVELGTSLGISGAYQASAMQMNGSGHLTTCEGAPALANIAQSNIDNLGISCCEVVAGPFNETYEDVLTARSPVDYAFIDGHHDESATLQYFRQLLPHLAELSMVVFDDINWSPGMRRAWGKITTAEGVTAVVYLQKLGVLILDRNSRERSPKYFEFYLR